MSTEKLYKTTIIIWSDTDPASLELSDLAREAESGDSYCAHQETVLVSDPTADAHPPDLEFFSSAFDEDEDDDEGEEPPSDFPVRVLRAGDEAEDRTTCNTCGRSWDDAVVTGYTPAPSARCPFETYHKDE